MGEARIDGTGEGAPAFDKEREREEVPVLGRLLLYSPSGAPFCPAVIPMLRGHRIPVTSSSSRRPFVQVAF